MCSDRLCGSECLTRPTLIRTFSFVSLVCFASYALPERCVHYSSFYPMGQSKISTFLHTSRVHLFLPLSAPLFIPKSGTPRKNISTKDSSTKEKWEPQISEKKSGTSLAKLLPLFFNMTTEEGIEGIKK